MAKKSVKHIKINKSQSQVLIIIALATVVVVFGLFGTKAMITKGLYQRRALQATNDAADQLKANYASAQKLMTQYKVFAEQEPNVIGGHITGSGPKDGDNAKIVLDALPSKYDAPALATSMEKILTDQNIKISSLSIADDPLGNPDDSQAKPETKLLTFTFAGSTNYKGATELLQALERSIRPFDITNLQVTGTDQSLTLTVNVNTNYQPPKNLDMKTFKEVK